MVVSVYHFKKLMRAKLARRVGLLLAVVIAFICVPMIPSTTWWKLAPQSILVNSMLSGSTEARNEFYDRYIPRMEMPYSFAPCVITGLNDDSIAKLKHGITDRALQLSPFGVNASESIYRLEGLILASGQLTANDVRFLELHGGLSTGEFVLMRVAAAMGGSTTWLTNDTPERLLAAVQREEPSAGYILEALAFGQNPLRSISLPRVGSLTNSRDFLIRLSAFRLASLHGLEEASLRRLHATSLPPGFAELFSALQRRGHMSSLLTQDIITFIRQNASHESRLAYIQELTLLGAYNNVYNNNIEAALLSLCQTENDAVRLAALSALLPHNSSRDHALSELRILSECTTDADVRDGSTQVLNWWQR